MPQNPFRQSRFLLSAQDDSHFPADTGREVAVVGRSNSGKSSVINTMTDQKNLARTSKTPGRTRLINFFEVEPDVRLVDLPGFGYARVNDEMIKNWEKVINSYLSTRQSLTGLILVTDIRRPIREEEELLINWCEKVNIPVHVLCNKADKLGKHKRNLALKGLREQLQGRQLTLQAFSTLQKDGLGELLTVLTGWLFE
ncbi:MAG: YihA family ribosome biogenesis GTP-binding protein [Gammaproteobacteria bacterium]|nr:YihA family ribosome biogenesis GTP-binding protein [Gammaproteobacteria bacterium]NIO62424.1 YihA family ribosome biogenesis GTP-binding protein [Gammaproteobacteria bacterium]